MKKPHIIMLTATILLALLALYSLGQTSTKTPDEFKYKIARIDATKVPIEVTKAFAKEFPSSSLTNWYGYPLVNEQEWYDDQTYLSPSDLPEESYIVEFSKDSIPQRAIYSKGGKKLAVHRKLKDDLPKEISTAMLNSEYKEWKLRDKEEIFKDKDTDKVKVYKVGVQKGKEKHDLYYQSQGKLLKDKKYPLKK